MTELKQQLRDIAELIGITLVMGFSFALGVWLFLAMLMIFTE